MGNNVGSLLPYAQEALPGEPVVLCAKFLTRRLRSPGYPERYLISKSSFCAISRGSPPQQSLYPYRAVPRVDGTRVRIRKASSQSQTCFTRRSRNGNVKPARGGLWKRDNRSGRKS